MNAVRFSPDGQWLATGDDGKINEFSFVCKFFFYYLLFFCSESNIILWKFKTDNGQDQRPDLLEDDESKNLEKWVCHCLLKGHLEDIYDLSWSPDSKQLISGGVDNKAIIWDIDNGNFTNNSNNKLTNNKIIFGLL